MSSNNNCNLIFMRDYDLFVSLEYFMNPLLVVRFWVDRKLTPLWAIFKYKVWMIYFCLTKVKKYQCYDALKINFN